MKAGPLDRRIVIQSPTVTQDGLGGTVTTWATFVEVWAAKQQATAQAFLGKEMVTADQEITVRRVSWRIRWLAGVTEKMRVSFEGQVYAITEVREVGRRDGLELHTTAIVDL